MYQIIFTALLRNISENLRLKENSIRKESEMSEIRIYSFSAAYVDSLVAISKLCFHSAWDRESFKNELQNGLARYVVAVIDNVAVGFGGMWLIIDEGHITNIGVHPEYRGIGIGDKILASLISICKEENICSMTLEVRASNYIAQNLYKNMDL